MKVDSFRRGVLAIGLSAVLVGWVNCKKGPAPATSTFPESSEVSGWTRSGEVRTFAAADLSNYIDGDAEKYLKAGVQSASTADYQSKDQTQAVVDVYIMSTQEAARTVFDSEPSADARKVPLGDAARLYTQSLVFRKGPYLVRIVAYRESPGLQQALVDLGQGIERKLSR
jgi:hypothetical protein